MRTILKNFYAGYEGEPEISFVLKTANGSELVFTMWYGHFYKIMEAVTPSPEGWTGLALPYHTVAGWWDDPDWKVPDAVEVVEQLEGLDRAKLPIDTREVLDDLACFIREGIERKDALHIQED